VKGRARLSGAANAAKSALRRDISSVIFSLISKLPVPDPSVLQALVHEHEMNIRAGLGLAKIPVDMDLGRPLSGIWGLGLPVEKKVPEFAPAVFDKSSLTALVCTAISGEGVDVA